MIKRLQLEIMGDLPEASIGQDVEVLFGEGKVACKVLEVTEISSTRKEDNDMIDRLLKKPREIKNFRPMTRDEIYDR